MHGVRARPLRNAPPVLVALQAGYYLATGVWPLLHRRSFEAVTGPKADFWLVRTVGVTVGAIGGGLALSARRGRLSEEMRATAILTSLGLCAIDVVYVARRRIRPVYLLDAAAEVVFAAALVTSGRSAADEAPRPARYD
jgi:hypothetical protein